MSQVRFDLCDLDVGSLIDRRAAVHFVAIHLVAVAGLLWLAGVVP